jgi:hypothetical protein
MLSSGYAVIGWEIGVALSCTPPTAAMVVDPGGRGCGLDRWRPGLQN